MLGFLRFFLSSCLGGVVSAGAHDVMERLVEGFLSMEAIYTSQVATDLSIHARLDLHNESYICDLVEMAIRSMQQQKNVAGACHTPRGFKQNSHPDSVAFIEPLPLPLLIRLILPTMVRLNSDTATETILEQGNEDELKVTFYPPLVLQRRMWILDVFRAENVTKVLDVGCGEGDLLRVLCEPAPWLTPPPPDVLPPPSGSSSSSDPISPSPTYNDEVPNLHAIHLHGLDISASDLEFAVKTTTPPKEAGHEEGSSYRLYAGIRWEDLKVALWKGGLEVFNEEFVDVECIVSTEVIEHLSQDILPAFAPMLLGVYHPRLLLVTTPSYTFNARFTAPTAPPSARKGYPDPTGRSDRIFRHDDHKFEWTVEEFQTWCHKVAHEWGYEVHISSIGRAMEIDAWGRDDELGGATSVAIFKRLEDETREARSREVLNTLQLPGGPHELLANHQHIAHPSSRKPKPLKEIGDVVQAKMEEFREAFMMVEELWFERDIAIACGGWIEFLIRAAEESDFLVLKRDGEDIKNQKRWIIELVGGVANQVALWPIEGDRSLDYIPANWVPEEGETESSEGEWGLGSTDMEGDVSWNGSEEEDNVEKSESSSWTSGRRGMLNESEKDVTANHGWNEVESYRIPHSSGSPTTGWDGDESDDTT